jgi:DNA-binding response OmpR family regulator
MHVLVIEDDPTVQTLIKMVLEKNDHEVVLADTAEAGQELAFKEGNDMIILDLGLPDGDGYQICKSIREEDLTTPVLVLSSEQETDVKVKCLQVGADDYLTKPFDNSELTARIDAILRRSNGEAQKEILSCGELRIDMINRSFTISGNGVELTNNEYNLLVYLLRHEGQIISQEEIAENVWDIHFDTHTNYINVYISYLRKKIRGIADHNYIETVRKKGFVIRCPE